MPEEKTDNWADKFFISRVRQMAASLFTFGFGIVCAIKWNIWIGTVLILAGSLLISHWYFLNLVSFSEPIEEDSRKKKK